MERDGQDDVVIPQQDAVKVFVNSSGQISIVQSSNGEDNFILVDRLHARKLASALAKLAKAG